MKVEKINLGKVSITVEKDNHTSSKAYDKLTIVRNEETHGTYISRIPVPIGILISNTTYWKLICADINYDAITAIINRLAAIENIITANNNGVIDKVTEVIEFFKDVADTTTLKNIITTLSSIQSDLASETTNRSNADITLQNTINGEILNRQNADGALTTRITSEELRAQTAENSIRTLFPNEASQSNKLADKNFVNSSIATATATFKGTYNVVTDLELAYNASDNQVALKLLDIVSTVDNQDYVFIQYPASSTDTNIIRVKRFKYNGTSWSFEYELNNSGFTAAQWATINSGITSSDKTIINFIGNIANLNTRVSSNIISALNALQGDLNIVVKNIIVKAGDKNSILETLTAFNERELDFDKYEEYWRDTRYILYHLGDIVTNPAINDSVLIVSISEQDTYSLQVATLEDILGEKVDKIQGKGLSTEDYTTTEKTKLSGIETGAEVNVQSNWNETNNSSDAYIQNKPTNISAFNNDAGYLTQHQDISNKADKSEMSVTQGTGVDADKTTIQLKSGTSATVLNAHQQLKTINNESITGSGNINIVTDTSDKADKVDVGDKANLTTTNKSTLVAAINEVNTKALTIGEVETFSTSENYQAGDYVIYNNKLYKFTSAHTAGAWVGTDADETTVVEELEEFTASADGLTYKVENFEGALVGNTQIEEFSESTTYGTDVSQVHYCYRNNLLYAAIATHTGAWNAAHFEQISILETTIPVYENVLIELKTFAEGTPIGDVNVTVQVEGEADARTLTTNADGKCSTTILRGLTYTITFPHIDNYIDLENVSRQAAIAQRTIIGKYRSILNPDIETVTVQVSYTTSGNKATSFNVVYDETDHTVNIDANTDTATFTVPEGFNYTIEMPYVEGYRTPGNVSIVAEGGNSRSIKRLYHPYIESGIFWKMKDGGIKELGDITREDYDNDRIFGLVFDTAELQGGNSFIIPFRYLINDFGTGMWLSSNIDVPELRPFITTDSAGLADFTGENNCKIIRNFCESQGLTSDVAQSTYSLVFEINGVERHCFTPSYGQFKFVSLNRNGVNDIVNSISGRTVINVNSGQWWLSAQYDNVRANTWNNGASNIGAKNDINYKILPILPY